MSTIHKHVEGASSSELLRPGRAAGFALGVTLAFVCVMLLVGPGDAAHDAPTDASSPTGSTLNSSTRREASHSNLRRNTPTSQIEESFRSSGAPFLHNPPQPSGIQADEEVLAPVVEQRAGVIPDLPLLAASSNLLLPDSEVINSPGSKNFDTAAFVTFQGGFLTQYRELVAGTWLSGAEIVERVALNHSINPRLLLAILEYRSGWVSDPRRPIGDDFYFPIRTANRIHQGLHIQLSWVANVLSRGYYGWHENVTDIGESEPRATVANPGTAALRQFLEEVCSSSDCEFDLMDTYRQLFGDPLEKMVDLNLEDLDQPDLILPFPGTNQWILTGGPHGAWGPDSPWAALDFAPKWDPLRRTSDMEVVAVADGVVARLDHGILVLDLDGDEYEQTGWSILYLHLVALEGIAQGDSVLQGQIIGEASSAGGVAGGDHIHLARKYDGVWIPASGPVPFKLGTWRVRTGAEAYEGELFQPARGCEDVEFSVPVGGSLRPAPVWDCRGYILN